MNKWNILENNQLSKDLKWKYKEMKQLFKNENLEENFFTDQFLDIYEEINDKLSTLLLSDEVEDIENEKSQKFIERVFQKSFNKAIETIINLGRWNIEKLNYSLFIPGKKVNQSNSNQNVNEIKEVSKYNNFLKVYYDLFLWRKGITIKVYEEKLNADKMRKLPYKIIHIQWWKFSRTILISDQIWQATFVYDWIIEASIFQNIKKWNPIDWNYSMRIIYGKNYSSDIKDIISEDFQFEIEVHNKQKTEKQILQEELNYIDQEELLQTLLNYEWRSIQESYDYFMSLKTWDKNNKNSIGWLKIKGKGVGELKTMSWIEIEWNITSPTKFKQWIQEIFKWEDIEKSQELIQEELLQTLLNYGWRSIQESYDYFMSLKTWDKNNKNSIGWLKIKGKGVGELKTISWIEIEWNITSPTIFKQWIQEIFKWENIDIQEIEKPQELTQEELLQTLLNYEWRSIQESYDYFMSLKTWDKDNKDSIKGLKIKGKSVIELKNISWTEIEWELRSPAIFKQWIQEIFKWEEIEKPQELIQEELLQTLLNYEWRSIQESYDYFMSLKTWDKDNKDSIKGLKIKGKSVIELKNISWIEIEWELRSPAIFKQWIQEIFKWEDIQFK